jgi:serine/threonine protein kinase
MSPRKPQPKSQPRAQPRAQPRPQQKSQPKLLQKTIGSYEVQREIGRGGMGVVYLARQPALDRSVVLKALRPECADDPQLVARFEREAQAAASVHHQNVVAVYDCFSWRGRSYICQEHIDGTDLAAAIGSGRLAPRIAGLIGLELARGLEAIAASGIVHRDLKPPNVLLGRGGEVKIADFGIALDAAARALTQTGHSVGTPRYMSPEQLYGERADTRSDLFALGVVMYEMCTSMAPFDDDGTDEGKTLVRRIEAERSPTARALEPRVPRAMSQIIATCLRAKSKKRWASARALRCALERHLGSPTSLESQAEIACWLRERELIESHVDDTVAATPAETRTTTASAPRRWAVALAAAAAIAIGTWLLDSNGYLPIDPRRLTMADTPTDSPAGEAAYSLLSTGDFAPTTPTPSDSTN